MLLEPEMLEQVEPDVHLVATLLSLSHVIPEKTKETARQVVRRVVDDLERKLAQPLLQAVRGSLNRASRTSRPRAGEIDWHRTIRANLKNYQPDRRTIIAEKLIGYGHKRSSLRDIVLCVDQSGSMASSVVYSGIFGAVLASLRAVSTRMVVFDTAVVDLSDDLQDPVDLLFGTQLGGGTDINRALAYCQQVITRPAQTILVLITDLYEGGERARDAASRGGAGCEWRAGRLPAGAQRQGRAQLRHRQCGGAGRHRHSQLRLHARPLPRPDGGGDPKARPRAVGGEERYRGRSRR